MSNHRSITWLALSLLAASCTDRPGFELDAGAPGSSGASDEGATTHVDPPPPPPPGTDGDDGTTAVPPPPGTDSDPTDDHGFVPVPDGGGGKGEPCTMEYQDCAPGFKCMPYDDQASGAWWNAFACFPIDPDPVGLYEPCQYEGAPWSGYDDCGWAQFCWDDDGDGMGTCKGSCVMTTQGDWDSLVCEDPLAVATVGCQECFCSCEVSCDPLVQDCGEGMGCYLIYEFYECTIDASDEAGPSGAAGDPCEYINVCDPGLMCVGWDAAVDCDPSFLGCCSPFCDVNAPNTCPGAAGGEECVAIFDPPEAAPPGLEHVGVCVLP